MIQLISAVDNIRFDIEDALEKQIYATLPLPFPGIDKSGAAVCEYFMRSNCTKGSQCPFRHLRGDKSVLCKHWLRGLCKKGDDCEFLHEYDMSKMPECYFYSKFQQCGNKECEFLHLDPESKIKDCPWYDRGFCRHGPNCKNRHVRKVICLNYICGFCPDGPSCKFKHPKFELPVPDAQTQQKKQLYQCDYCGEYGHKVTSCFKLNPENRQLYQNRMIQQQFAINPGQQQPGQPPVRQPFPSPQQSPQSQPNQSPQQQHQPRPFHHYNQPRHHHHSNYNNHFHHHHNHHHNNHHNQNNNHHGVGGTGDGGATPSTPRPPSEVVCFKCGDKGHYANKCNKGLFAFLRSNPNEQKV